MTAKFTAPASMPIQVGMVAVAQLNIKAIGSYNIEGQKIWVENALEAEVYLAKILQLMKAGVEATATKTAPATKATANQSYSKPKLQQPKATATKATATKATATKATATNELLATLPF